MLNNKGPKIEPCGTPSNISPHELYFSFILTLAFYLRGNYLLVSSISQLQLSSSVVHCSLFETCADIWTE